MFLCYRLHPPWWSESTTEFCHCSCMLNTHTWMVALIIFDSHAHQEKHSHSTNTRYSRKTQQIVMRNTIWCLFVYLRQVCPTNFIKLHRHLSTTCTLHHLSLLVRQPHAHNDSAYQSLTHASISTSIDNMSTLHTTSRYFQFKPHECNPWHINESSQKLTIIMDQASQANPTTQS